MWQIKKSYLTIQTVHRNVWKLSIIKFFISVWSVGVYCDYWQPFVIYRIVAKKRITTTNVNSFDSCGQYEAVRMEEHSIRQNVFSIAVSEVANDRVS